MPRYTPERGKIEVDMIAKSFLKNGSGTAMAIERGTTQQNENKKLRRKSVQDRIRFYLSNPKFAKQWREQGEEGAFRAERSIGAAILVQKDGTLVKADDEGGITMPDHSTRHKYWRDLGLAAGFLIEKPIAEVNLYTQIWNGIEKKAKDVEANGRVHIGNKTEVPT